MANGPVNPKLHKDLLLACGWGKEIDVVLLLQQGASVKVQDQNGRNCLHYAASKGHTNIVEILLLKKCNANAKDKYGSTPLHQAAVNGHAECANILIEGGSDVNFQDDNGNTPLYEAVWHNQAEAVDLFLNNEADVNIRNKEGYTPLHLACQNNNGKVIQNLVKWGANLQSPTSTGNTPLHVAIQHCQTDAVKTLLALEADINLQNHSGNTPMHLCAELGDKKMTTLLLESGQPYEASLNNVGDSPKDIAVQLGNREVAELIPTPMVGRKLGKKTNEPAGSPKRVPKHKSTKPKQVTAKEGEDKTDSLERPVRVVVQPPSVDNLLATDTGSSLSSLWLPAQSANETLPMDVYWQKNVSPGTERKARIFENIKDLATLKEIKLSEQQSQSDASSVKSPRYQIRKKRRKYATGHVGSKQKGKYIEEEIEDEKESKRLKDPKTAKLFKKKKQSSVKKSSIKRLKKVDEQREEEEYSIASPVSQIRSETTSGVASPRVKGRAELKVEFMNESKDAEDQNGDVQMELRIADEQKAKGLREYLKSSLVSRKSPANTDEGSSSKTGTLEHKKGKDNRLIQAELKEHMKLTPKDIDALIKKEILEGMKSNNVGLEIAKDRKPSKKASKKPKKKSYEKDDNEEEIVVIRLDPTLETPKKSKRGKDRKSLENGVSSKDGNDTIKREKHRSKGGNGGEAMDISIEGGTLRRDAAEKKGDKSNLDGSKIPGKTSRKQEHKDWPKFEVMLDETCGPEPGPSGKSTPHSRSYNQSFEKTQRSSHHHSKKSSEAPSKETTVEMIHKLEKRFRHFLQLTTERLDEQKEIDNKHYSDLKNDISSMEKSIERTTRNSAIEILDSVTKELDCTMRKWAKALKGRKFEERKDTSSTTSSTFDIVRSCDEDGGRVITKAVVQQTRFDAEAEEDDRFVTSTPVKSCKIIASKTNGHVVRENPDESAELMDEGTSKEATRERAEVCTGCEHDDSVDVHREGRAAPQGRSDESSPCLQSRFPGDGDHMSLEKWYQEQLKEAEERWRIKAEADQQALRNRIKELEDTLFEFTGTHNTMV